MSDKLGIIPPTGEYGTSWPSKSVLSQGINGSLSDAGWTEHAQGIPQQTFLGASIINFDLNAGFGDTTTTLSLDVVNDEFNLSDQTGLGLGDDPYHDGKADQFSPPIVGTPVYFKFGTNPATIEQAFRKTFDDTYPEYGDTLEAPVDFPEIITDGEIESIPGKYYFLRSVENKGKPDQRNTWVDKSALWKFGTKWRGKDHLAFGGILQSYTQNRSPGGDPLYSLQVTDPREILSNASVILNNYAGTTYNNKNLLNVFGFLEHDPSEPLLKSLEAKALSKNVVRKLVDPNTGNFIFIGDDNYAFFDVTNPFAGSYNGTFFNASPNEMFPDELGRRFPITGQGFARRSERGMPWYRIKDGLSALMNYEGFLPTEYKDAGYGGAIDFRGYKFVVDFGGIPTDLIPPTFFLEYDQLDLLSLAQELCDVISHDLFVSLLPVIDHPSCKIMYDFNQSIINDYPQFASQIITGIIRIDAIDKRKPPSYGAIKSFLDDLKDSDVEVENQDLGYELSNVTTDKFIAGAQQVDMHYFTTNKDRNDVELRKHKDGKNSKIHLMEREKWSLRTMLKQQVVPFYGFIGEDKAVTIPKGFGSYQQICLDATALNAYGVGNYYIATEIELRAALVSYQQWKTFLLKYDEQWMKRLRGPQKLFDAHVPADVMENIEGLPSGPLQEQLKVAFDGEYGVSVPRCVWRSDKNYMGEDDLPASPCAPPYGYPLYYKRAEKIGIPEGGVISVINGLSSIRSNIERLKDKADKDAPFFNLLAENALESAKEIERDIHLKLVQLRKAYSNDLAYKAAAAVDMELNALRLALIEAKAFAVKMEKDLKQHAKQDEILMGELRDHIKNNDRLVKNVSHLAKEGEKNAMKVYEFVKRVASENLGKKFLVKIPKKTNMNFSDRVTYWDESNSAQSIKTGPFGFKPIPVTATSAYYYTGSDWITTFQSLRDELSFEDVFEDYLDFEQTYDTVNAAFLRGYNNGALKSNYNPFADRWEHNYKPESQGGYVNHELRGFQIHPNQGMSDGRVGNVYETRALPKDLREALTPLDAQNFVSQNGRMSCYVRFDNSHFYDFSKIAKGSMSQQSINNHGFIVPDIMEELDNVNPDKSMTMDQVQAKAADDKRLDRQNPSLAFVKCSVDEELYMPPPMTIVPTKVFARGFKLVVPTPRMEIIKVPLDDDPDTPEDESKCLVPSGVVRKVIPVFSPHTPEDDDTTVNTIDFDRRGAIDGKPVYVQDTNPADNPWAGWGTFAGDIASIDLQAVQLVNSTKSQLSANHVYALVTLPGMVTSTVDLRYCDGPLSSYETVSMYSLQTRDVVKGLQEFNKPAVITNGDVDEKCENLQQFTVGEINDARKARKEALKHATVAAMENQLSFISPSPVYPDMVAIPLMSMERSYGPWLSNASLDPATLSPGVSNIGGKVEFEQDENLAPWNFGGYQLMNEAGYLRAQFSNSLLLFSERGGFVIPKPPTGVSLAKTLKLGGPLVTSISTGISKDKISTTIKMDLYTSSFGKLQKQKEGNIAQITRERQKIKDQNNNAIRRGMGKTLSNKNLYETVLRGGGQEILDQAANAEQTFSDFEMGKRDKSNMLISYKKEWSNGSPASQLGKALVDTGELIKHGVNTVQGTIEDIRNAQSLMEDGIELAQQGANFVSQPMSNFIKLIPWGNGLPQDPAIPQEKKDVEQRRGPEQEEE